MATICWASTSSALRGTTVGSISPSCMRRATHGALEQIAAELGEDPPVADLVDAVPGTPDALQAARDGLGRLDLHDEVDGAHVDAELERAGGDEAGQLAGLEQLLDLRALLARERAVVRAGDLLPPSGTMRRAR